MSIANLKLNTTIFLLGGVIYILLEIIYRGFTHWTMFFAGGVCCLIVFKIFMLMKPCSIIKKCIVGSFVITLIELICGCIVNLWLHMNIWDYSQNHFNFLGQICLFNSFIWAILSLPICFVCEVFKNTKFNFKFKK